VGTDDGTYALCPWCRENVVPDGEGVHFAVELQRVDSFEGTDWVEGIGGFLHPGRRVPEGWRAKPMPPLQA